MKRRLAMALLLGLVLSAGAAWAQTAGDAGCRSCHPNMDAPMPPAGRGPALSCTACHLGDGAAREAKAGHQGMAANPSALDQAPRACGPCHAGWPQKVRRSPMATNVGIINQTRFLWGAQSSLAPEYGVREQWPLVELPGPHSGGQPVDDFLRRRCLRCHLWGKGADSAGARRSAGCAACHRPYDAQGRPPRGHGLTKKVPVRQCLTCHGGGCGAGAEYAGRTARDAIDSARFLAVNRQRPRLIQNRAWRPMRPDAHFRAGLACIDCHPRGEIMGKGTINRAGLEHVGLRCFSCHGRPGQPPPQRPATTLGAELSNLAWRGGKLELTGRLDAKKHQVPLLPGGGAAPVAHRVKQHRKVACHACHAAYNPGAWGLQVMLETRPSYSIWSPIAAQGDPQVFRLLNLGQHPPGQVKAPPVTRDYLDGAKSRGMWLVSPWFRRLLWRVYGVGPQGRSYLLNPRFQYVVSLMDRQGRVTQGAKIPPPGLGVTPWNPHTTAKATVGCADCHGAARALGLGLTFTREGKPGETGNPLAPGLWLPGGEGVNLAGDWARVVDLAGRAQQAFLVNGSRPYNRQELDRLLRPGKEYNRWLLKALEEQWPLRPTGPKQ